MRNRPVKSLDSGALHPIRGADKLKQWGGQEQVFFFKGCILNSEILNPLPVATSQDPNRGWKDPFWGDKNPKIEWS